MIGVTGWILIAPSMESAAGYRIDPTNVPWVVVAATMLLAVVASTASAWWPGRTVSRIPTVLALSGRPPRPAPLHRSTALAVVLLVVGVVCLVIGGRATNGMSTPTELVVVCVGILGVVGGVLLVSPLAVRGARRPRRWRTDRRTLGAAGPRPLSAPARRPRSPRWHSRSDCPSSSWPPRRPPRTNSAPATFPPTRSSCSRPDSTVRSSRTRDSIASMQDGVDAIADALDDPAVLRLDGAVNPNARPDPNVDAVPGISVARKHGDEGWADLGLIYVATPELLDQYGLAADAADDAGILTRFALPLDVMDLGDAPPPPSRSHDRNRGRRAGRSEPLEAPGDLPDTYTALPGALVSTAELAARGWTAEPSGRWLITNTAPLTPAELEAARAIAVQYGLSIEARDESSTLANVRTGAVAVGMILALGILAMTVGLIRCRVGRRTAHADRHRCHRIDPPQDHRRDRRRTRRARRAARHRRRLPRARRRADRRPRPDPDRRPRHHRDRHADRGRRGGLGVRRPRARSARPAPDRLTPIDGFRFRPLELRRAHRHRRRGRQHRVQVGDVDLVDTSAVRQRWDTPSVDRVAVDQPCTPAEPHADVAPRCELLSRCPASWADEVRTVRHQQRPARRPGRVRASCAGRRGRRVRFGVDGRARRAARPAGAAVAGAAEGAMLDPAVALTYVAAHTSTIRLATGIIILPQRNPLVLAKELASVDVVSEGRLLFGYAAGYLQQEFAALGIPFEDRGALESTSTPC